FENWTLPTRETNTGWVSGFDFIRLEWTKTKPFGLSQVEIINIIVFGSIICIVLIITSIFTILRLKKPKESLLKNN
ncbi:MAG: hypothetical protein ACW97X_13405, partial [Candidatus Hodarchaeales archaeon]